MGPWVKRTIRSDSICVKAAWAVFLLFFLNTPRKRMELGTQSSRRLPGSAQEVCVSGSWHLEKRQGWKETGLKGEKGGVVEMCGGGETFQKYWFNWILAPKMNRITKNQISMNQILMNQTFPKNHFMSPTPPPPPHTHTHTQILTMDKWIHVGLLNRKKKNDNTNLKATVIQGGL